MLRRTPFRQIRPAFPPKLRDREPAEPATVRPLVKGSYGPSCEGVAQPKHPASRNSALRELARGEECTVQAGGRCSCDPETTVWAHTNKLSDNKGMGYKGSDSEGFFAGYACHCLIDQGGLPAEQTEALVTAAQERTRIRLEEIASSKTLRLRKVEAARWALEQLKEKV